MEPAGAAASLPEEEPTHGWQIRHVINLHKVTIAPYCLLIFALGGLSPLGGEPASLTAAIYLALHGAYGLLWCFKDVYFGDANWKKDLDLGTGVALFLSLQLYTAAPILIARNHPATPAWLALLSVAVWGAGVFLHYGADIQKHYVLKTRREEGGGKKLITDGFFKHMRHPNYLGEVLIYAAFALLAQHPIPWAVNAFFWLGVFLPNMQKKEKSMSRYPEWDAYAARTGFLLPKLGVLTDMFPSAFVPAAGGEAAKAE